MAASQLVTQVQIPHPPGSLPACTGCKREPRHYRDRRAARSNGGDFLECACCGRRTSRHLGGGTPMLLDWHRINGTVPSLRSTIALARIGTP